MKFFTIETNRLLLKAYTPEVYQHAFLHLPDREIKSIFGHQNDEEFKVEKERFEKGMTTFNKSFLFFQIRDKLSDTFLGWCGYHTWYFTHFRAEVFYMLYNDNDRNKGIMTEALAAVLQYGFKQMNLLRVEAFAAKDNIPSLALLKHFGFKEEGLFREHYNVNGVNSDSVAYGLLKREFIL